MGLLVNDGAAGSAIPDAKPERYTLSAKDIARRIPGNPLVGYALRRLAVNLGTEQDARQQYAE
jgi:hypothetical protein